MQREHGAYGCGGEVMTELTRAQKIKYLNRLEWFLEKHFDCEHCPLDNFNYRPGTHSKHFGFSSITGLGISPGFCEYCRGIVDSDMRFFCPCSHFGPKKAKRKGFAAIKRERKKLGVKS